MDPRTDQTLRTLLRKLHGICGDLQTLSPELMADSERSQLGGTMQTFLDALAHFEHAVGQARNRSVAADLRRVLDAQPQGLRLHIGAGAQRLPGWINIDAPPADLPLNVARGLPLPDGVAARIFASHVLEHLYYPTEAETLLRHCSRVLEPGGVLRLIVPDAHACLQAYAGRDHGFFAARRRAWPDWPADRTMLEDTLAYLGAFPDPGSLFEAHRYGYDFETLERLLLRCGFASVIRSGYMGSAHEELRIDDASSVAGHVHGDANYSLFVEAVR